MTDSAERGYERIEEAVADLSRSFLMTSGAGCGKTYQMVQRYTNILASGAHVGEIVAVTFTEKAAAELRDRVRAKCRENIAEDPENRDLWERAAREMAVAPIGTIHALCARLLRENAVQAGVDPRFGQLDETQQHFLLRDVVRDTLLQRLHGGEATAERIVARWGLAEAVGKLRGMVGDRERLADLLESPPSAEELLGRWREAYMDAMGDRLQELLGDPLWATATESLQSVPAVNIDDSAAERHRPALDAIARALDESLPLHERFVAFGEAIGWGHKGRVGRKSNWSAAKLARLREGLYALGELRDRCREEGLEFAALEDSETAELAHALCVEAAAAAAAYAEEKQRRSVLDFADLQILARDLLRDHPDVLQAVRERYQWVLVDEFQDTNALQKDIIWLLAGGDVRDGTPPRPGALFAVGDAKQSIYRFRGADVTVITETEDDFRGPHDGCGVLRLRRSRRSHPRLTELLNFVFDQDAVMGDEGQAAFEATYECVEAHREDLLDQHDAELMLVAAPAAEEGDGEDGDGLTTRQARMREAEAIARRIREIVEAGEMRVGEKRQRGDGEEEIVHRAPTWRDFGILFAAMTDVGIYEYALRREGIPFYTVAGRGFYNRQEIRDCINLLSALENLTDELSLVGALRSPMFAVSDDTLYWLTRPRLPLMDAMRQAADGDFEHQQHIKADQQPRLQRAVRVIDRLRAARDRLTLSELMERVAAETGLASVHLTQFAGRQAAANIRKLADLARRFEATGEYSLRRFVEYLRDLVVSEEHEGLATVHEEASDVVRLLTVHKAKGLEWPIVVVPDLARPPRAGSADPLLDERMGPVPKMESEDGEATWGAAGSLVRCRHQEQEVAERRRLLYVALTRARDHLILSASYELNKDGTLASNVDWLRWLSEAFGIDLQEITQGRTLGEGAGWSCLLTVPDLEAGKRPEARGFPERAEPEALARAAEAASGGVEHIPPLALPIAPTQAPLRRFTVTELVHYRACPRLYMLRHLLDMPERPRGGDWLSSLSAADRGDVVHAALEAIGRRGLEDGVIEQALEVATFPHAISSRLAPGEREQMRDIIRWFVHDAPVDGEEARIYRDWIATADRLRGEVQFAVTVDGVLVEGTVDALAERSDGHSRILDYKTGRPDERKLDEYRFQIGLYCAALQAAGRPLPEAAALVLLDQRRIIRLGPGEWADAARRELSHIVEQVRGGRFDRPEPCPLKHCTLAYACERA